MLRAADQPRHWPEQGPRPPSKQPVGYDVLGPRMGHKPSPLGGSKGHSRALGFGQLAGTSLLAGRFRHHRPSKLVMRVRFPSPAPDENRLVTRRPAGVLELGETIHDGLHEAYAARVLDAVDDEHPPAIRPHDGVHLL
jgi:hypothetical protein